MIRRLGWAAAAGLVAGLLILGWGWHQWTGPGPAGLLQADGTRPATALVRIPPGMSLGAAADTLVSRGLLGDRRVLLAGARLTGRERGLRAGLFSLTYTSSPRDLLTDLTSGLAVQVRFTIPEGLTAEETATLVAQAMGFPADVFLAQADSLTRGELASADRMGTDTAAAYEALLGASGPPVVHTLRWSEGYLAPDTYLFAEGTDAAAVAAHLVETQFARLDAAWTLRDPGGTSRVTTAHGLLTLASIVEAEARRDDERAQVAAVYHNRLRRNWRLEADPTVAFLLHKKGQRLFYRDLDVTSPFNTYRNKGLPPGPIGAPGQASLMAAARPDTTSQAMYFVSDGADGHVFSRTSREHEAAVKRFKAARAARAAQRRSQ